jgi:TRAP-type uncharacterized transport system fused permease subunit
MIRGPIIYTVFRIITVFFAISTMSMAFLGYCNGNLGWIARLIILLCSLLLIPHNLVLNIMGYLIFFGIMWRERVYPYLGFKKSS